MKSYLTVGEVGVDEMGIGKTGVDEMVVGEMGISHDGWQTRTAQVGISEKEEKRSQTHDALHRSKGCSQYTHK